MIQTIIPALTVLAEEFLLARRVLDVYNVVHRVDDLLDLKDLVSSMYDTEDKTALNEELIFYILTAGLYSAANSSYTHGELDYEYIFSLTDKALASDGFNNADQSSASRLSAFAESLGRVISAYDPEFVNPLSELIVLQDKSNVIANLFTVGCNRSDAMRLLTNNLHTRFDVSITSSRKIIDMFSDYESSSDLKSLLGDIRGRYEGVTIETNSSFAAIVYSIIASSGVHSPFVSGGSSVFGSLYLAVGCLPTYNSSQVVKTRRVDLWQAESLTNALVQQTEHKMMNAMGYTYLPDIKEWAQPAKTALERKQRQDPNWTPVRDAISGIIVETISSKLRKLAVDFVTKPKPFI